MSELSVFVMTGASSWGTRSYDYQWDKLPKQVQTYVRLFRTKTTYIESQYGDIPVAVLIWLTKFFNTEFAVCLLNNKLYIVKGKDANITAGNAGSVSPLPHSRMLIHVHPATVSYKSHITQDLIVNNRQSLGAEAVVDFNYDFIVFQNNQVFNRKNPDSSYATLDHSSDNWPDFLLYRAWGNVSVKIPD